jgi:two-component system sensor histidine kinase VicK
MTAMRSEYDIFDRNPDASLDELTELSAVLGGAEFAYMGWMDSSRLWFKSRHGFTAAEQPRSTTACQWTLQQGSPLLIRDAAQDSRFPPEGIPLAGVGYCRSYAGAPLYVGVHQMVGALAILSRQPNQFSEEHLALLDIVARQASTRLELYARIRAQELEQRTRIRAERALAVERCFVAATLDSVPALVAVLDTAGRLVRMNQPCVQLTGLNPIDAIGIPFIDAVLESEDRAWALTKVREAALDQLSGPHENTWRVAQGGGRRIRWTLRPLKGPNHEIQYLIVSGQDVTEQRQIEQALLSNETRYREVVESSLGFVFTSTLEGRLTSLNSFTAETLGYRLEDLTGRALSDLLDASGAAALQERQRTLEAKEEWQGALPVRRSDGAVRRIAFRSRLVQLNGERPFVLNHGIDVTEQYEAEEALRLATRQRELILESVDDGIFGLDLNGKLTFINRAAANTLGYQPEELAGRDMHDVLHHTRADGGPYPRTADPILQALRRNETARQRDEIFWRKDGSAVLVEYNASPLQENGETAGMVVAFQDVSERRRLERMKDEFISTVSHELRTPLTSLRASLGLISSGSLDRRPEKQKQMAELAIDNCDRLIQLVNDILDFDQLRKGQMLLNRQPVEAENLLRRAADIAHAEATQARIKFLIETAPVKVLADEERILQVLNELVENAIKFSPPDTTIRLSAQPTAAAAGSKPGALEEATILVEDQGRGIPPDQLEHIFDRFQQGDGSDSRKRGGTGLGLALCRSIVEEHGGRLWAENNPERGSRFLFTLPAAR